MTDSAREEQVIKGRFPHSLILLGLQRDFTVGECGGLLQEFQPGSVACSVVDSAPDAEGAVHGDAAVAAIHLNPETSELCLNLL